MKKSMWAILCIVLAMAVAGIYFKIVNRSQLSDEECIYALLAKGKSAIEHKYLKSALSCVSKDYSDSAGYTFDSLRALALEAFSEEGKYIIKAEKASVKVDGDAACADTRVFITLRSDDGGTHTIFSGPMSISLKKEKSKRRLIIPTRSWKVTGISGLTGVFEE